ncbi:MAG: tetratricopeptide repeat protein [Deltaproteobacteria bacterium]|nr:tetratricopeptide repeat protein [Deltaproteobacteria bacterium]
MQCINRAHMVNAIAFLLFMLFLSQSVYAQAPLKPAQEAYAKAQTAWEKGEWETALGLCDEALKIDKRSKEVWQLKGQIYWQMKNYKMALKSYQDYLKIDPKSALVWVNLSATFFELEQYKSMEESYAKAKEIDPKYPPLYQSMGVNYLKMGNYEEANKAFATLEEMGENSIYYLWTKRVLQIINSNYAPAENWKVNPDSYQTVLDLSDPAKTGYLVMLTSSVGTSFKFSGSSDNPFKYAPNFDVWNGTMIFDKKGEGLLTNGTHFRYRSISGDTLTIEEGVITNWRLDLTSKKCFLLTQ